MKERQWHWIDWALLGLYVLWIISGILYMLFTPGFVTLPDWQAYSLFILSGGIPLLFWRPGYIHPRLFIASEIICAGGINVFMHFSMPMYLDNMVVPSLLAGFLSSKRMVWWSAPIFTSFPLLGIWSGKIAWFTVPDQMINHLILFGIGYGFNVFLHNQQRLQQLLRENERQFLTIQQYAEQVERLTVQEERSRVAGELHDALGHSQASLIMGLETVYSLLDTEPEQAKQRLGSVLQHARSSFAAVRHHIHGIALAEHSEIDMSEHVQNMLNRMSEQTGIKSRLIVSGEPRFIPFVHRVTLERCVQEAITNAVRHGQAEQIEVEMAYTASKISVTIEDDGGGSHGLTFGYGLTSMQERLQAYGGSLDIASQPDGGTRVSCCLPAVQPESEPPIRLFIADDEQLTRESLHFLSEKEQGLIVSGTAANGREAIERIAGAEEEPHVVLMDIRMPVMDGIAAAREIKDRWPHIKLMMLTTIDEMEHAVQAIEAGAEGYLLKSIHPQELFAMIRLVSRGSTFVPQSLARAMTEQIKQGRPEGAGMAAAEDVPAEDPFGLTEREREVLHYLAEGMKYREIAARLYLSEGTVRNHVSSLYAKLGVHDRLSAANAARRAKLVRD
ncbi:helix-turn-helix transcriptional regulator [Paenibacillus apiarius]|uniref:Hybrid sensor histidine kinase/response regulator transcription factor n=1 Tax=Paenibacillus apiarius TaxID=46240 RepID=A0ABT4DR63_9BACL|nr:hybrid sensor histidine kinase/response regulator transcription factor [Paenibacillus apiarius]MCY9516227.1 hybrid sensor histidine kinase/response regulator transcription factor [Paenibacillus apiarius]MCY9519761.1 hybrid sensor histidine kinase/response regulator transcription factor [Paenibacillus apiarius]MCY9555287.1 hybrid sensor histidine kinase/response regulator transcription factor [Paenibacillus apiarius]MCY9559354.1 hybrid sensor histidine kinase/response regulator transcription 